MSILPYIVSEGDNPWRQDLIMYLFMVLRSKALICQGDSIVVPGEEKRKFKTVWSWLCVHKRGLTITQCRGENKTVEESWWRGCRFETNLRFSKVLLPTVQDHDIIVHYARINDFSDNYWPYSPRPHQSSAASAFCVSNSAEGKKYWFLVASFVYKTATTCDRVFKWQPKKY